MISSLPSKGLSKQHHHHQSSSPPFFSQLFFTSSGRKIILSFVLGGLAGIMSVRYSGDDQRSSGDSSSLINAALNLGGVVKGGGGGGSLSKEGKDGGVEGGEGEWYFKPVPELKQRREIGPLLEEEKMKIGAEVGVQLGYFGELTMSNWPSCRKYYAIDLWRSQKNYEDIANKNDAEQTKIYWEARDRLLGVEKTQETEVWILPMLSLDAARMIPDEELDYVYIDARHDYCGVMEDLIAYYPKVRPGGLVAGHDYIYAKEGPHGEDWSLCADGTHNDGAVRGAVDEFAEKNGLTVWSIWHGEQPSWILRKPEWKPKGSTSTTTKKR